MTMDQWSELLFWSALINMGFLALSSIVTMLAPGLIYRIHGRFFHLPEERVAQSLYLLIGLYKILIITFLITPWIATLILS
ncbi:MAG: DUF6868 family protein [Halioglobus sp.]